MFISSSDISMSSSRNYLKSTKGERTTTRWALNNPQNVSTTVMSFSSTFSEDTISQNYNDFAKTLRESELHNTNSTSSGFGNIGINGIKHKNSLDSLSESIQKTLHELIDMLYKAKGLTRDTSNGYNYVEPTFLRSNQNTIAAMSTTSIAGAYKTTWNVFTTTKFDFYEAETTTFSSTGTAICADGRKLEFDVSFSMSREFEAEYFDSSFMQYDQVFTDPLVISLDSNPASVSDQVFLFDIDCDGEKDCINSLSNGSGFLAYDKNNDGIINDGSELFGTQSGNGFADLAKYDLDGNGWIDEADDIFKHLKVWTKDEDGNDVLLSLKEADVGAIYLGSSESNYTFTNDRTNDQNALLKRQGIFLHESGSTGFISQIDFAKH